MSLPGLLISALIALVAGVIVARPLLRDAARRGGRQRELDRLTAAYERVLTNIRDLDEDQRTGKIGIEEYAAEREVWMRQGISILRAMDAHEAREGEIADDIDAAIEAAIRAARECQAEPTAATLEGDS